MTGPVALTPKPRPSFHFHLRGSDGGYPVGSAAKQLRQLHHIRLPATVDEHAGEGRTSCNLADQPILVGVNIRLEPAPSIPLAPSRTGLIRKCCCRTPLHPA